MRLPFLSRTEERSRLRRALRAKDPTLSVVYGRRRVGKSRLVQEVVRDLRAVYFVGDERDAPLQRRALAREAARLLPRFDEVVYPDRAALLERFYREAPRGSVLALD